MSDPARDFVPPHNVRSKHAPAAPLLPPPIPAAAAAAAAATSSRIRTSPIGARATKKGQQLRSSSSRSTMNSSEQTELFRGPVGSFAEEDSPPRRPSPLTRRPRPPAAAVPATSQAPPRQHQQQHQQVGPSPPNAPYSYPTYQRHGYNTAQQQHHLQQQHQPHQHYRHQPQQQHHLRRLPPTYYVPYGYPPPPGQQHHSQSPPQQQQQQQPPIMTAENWNALFGDDNIDDSGDDDTPLALPPNESVNKNAVPPNTPSVFRSPNKKSDLSSSPHLSIAMMDTPGGAGTIGEDFSPLNSAFTGFDDSRPLNKLNLSSSEEEEDDDDRDDNNSSAEAKGSKPFLMQSFAAMGEEQQQPSSSRSSASSSSSSAAATGSPRKKSVPEVEPRNIWLEAPAVATGENVTRLTMGGPLASTSLAGINSMMQRESPPVDDGKPVARESPQAAVAAVRRVPKPSPIPTPKQVEKKAPKQTTAKASLKHPQQHPPHFQQHPHPDRQQQQQMLPHHSYQRHHLHQATQQPQTYSSAMYAAQRHGGSGQPPVYGYAPQIGTPKLPPPGFAPPQQQQRTAKLSPPVYAHPQRQHGTPQLPPAYAQRGTPTSASRTGRGYDPTIHHSAIKMQAPNSAASGSSSGTRKRSPSTRPRRSPKGKENSVARRPAQVSGTKPTPCRCKKSKCLKLYCECFSNRLFCDGCKCFDCRNTPDFTSVRDKAVNEILLKNRQAFDSRVPGSDSVCKCRRSECLKKYCECFSAGIVCNAKCKCTGCMNVAGSQKLIDKRRKMKDKKGAEYAVRISKEIWERPKHSPQYPPHRVPMASPSMHQMGQSPMIQGLRVSQRGGRPGVRPHFAPRPPFIGPPMMGSGSIGYSPLGPSAPPDTPGYQLPMHMMRPPCPAPGPAITMMNPSTESVDKSKRVAQEITPAAGAGATPRTPGVRLSFDLASSRKKRKIGVGAEETVRNYFGRMLPPQPKTTILSVFSFLTNEDIYNAGLVCKDWSTLSMDNELWRFG